MGSKTPTISVIIPTHNRQALLRRTLDALCLQKYPACNLEVIVVADGCTDDTVSMTQKYRAPFYLHTIEQPNQGSGMARNMGATQSRGPLLLFLDDDVEPTPSLVGEHIRAHEQGKDWVVVGPCLPSFQGSGFLQLFSRARWSLRLEKISKSGHRFTYQDLLSGNFSIGAAFFAKVGGFNVNQAFRAHEDHELGVRLIKSDARFTYASTALAYHHDKMTFDRSFQRSRHEGIADVELARRYPEIHDSLPFLCSEPFSRNSFPRRILWNLLLAMPSESQKLVTSLQAGLDMLEWGKLRDEWKELFKTLGAYWYWKGVIDALGSIEVLRDLVQESTNFRVWRDSSIELDLKSGLELAEQRLDEERPMAASIRYGSTPVGVIPPQPGAEPLRGIHLRPYLSDRLTVPFLEALVVEGGISSVSKGNRFMLANSIREKSPWFGPIPQGRLWWEQSRQWRGLNGKEVGEQRIWMELHGLKETWGEKTKLEEDWAYWQDLAEKYAKTMRENESSLRKFNQ